LNDLQMQTNFLATPQQWREAWQRNWTSNGLKQVRVAVAYVLRDFALELIGIEDPKSTRSLNYV